MAFPPIIQQIHKYILDHYDDPVNGTPKQIDPLELASFLYHEEIDFTYARDTRAWSVSIDDFKRWTQHNIADVRSSQFATWAEFYDAMIAPSMRSTPIPAPAPAQPAARVTAAVPRPTVLPFQRILSVGDAHASRATNSELTVSLARPHMPTAQEYVVPIDPRQLMELTLRFESVDWPTQPMPQVPALERPSQVYIAPSDYFGPLPPTPESLQQWEQEHKQRLPKGSPFGLTDSDRLHRRRLTDFFRVVKPPQVGNSTVTVAMPPGHYQIRAQAGQRNSAVDRFDNYTLEITGKNIQPDPEFGTLFQETVVLGEEVYRMMRPRADGSLEPLPLLPQTADAGTSLYSQAYQFHPVARDPRAAANTDSRLFTGLVPGRQYTFTTHVRGFDGSHFTVTVTNGRQTHQWTPGPEHLGNTGRAKQWFGSLLPHMRRFALDRTFETNEPWHRAMHHGHLYDTDNFRWSRKQPARLVLERDEDHPQRAYVSLFAGEDRQNKLVARSQAVPLAIAQDVFNFRSGDEDWIEASIASVERKSGRMPETAGIPVAITFTATDTEARVDFVSPGVETLVRRLPNGWPMITPISCDELRFDRIRMLDTTTGTILPPQLPPRHN